MRRWRFEDGFGLENLRLNEAVAPTPRRGEVRLTMRAASLNYRDLVVMRGQHGRSIKPPLVPLSDGVGVVDALGEDVSEWRLGDRLAPAFYQHWLAGMPPANLDKGRLGGPFDGVLSTQICVPSQALVRVPDHLTDVEAATLPCAGVTAWSALTSPTSVVAGQSVLILGTGGVALIAASLARAMGAQVIMTTSRPDMTDRLMDIGAHHVIDRSAHPDWAKEVRRITGAGCDRVLDLGGAETLNPAVAAVRTGGVIILIGNVTGDTAPLFLPMVLTRRITLHSVSCGSRSDFVGLCGALEQHQIRPLIDHNIPFERAPEAFVALEKQRPFGKLGIKFADWD